MVVDQIPHQAYAYQRVVVREAQAALGLSAPVSRFAGQIHQESGWNSNARSKFAGGLAQFTPDTASWIAKLYPKELGAAAPYSPQWAIKALVAYDKYLYDRVPAVGKTPFAACDRWAMALSAYNGGLGWVAKDRKLAVAHKVDPNRWWNGVDQYTARAAQFKAENRGYPQRIMLRWEPLYYKHGWGGVPACK